MIESIEFTNFKAMRKTTLPLAPFTLLLGPNGSGKTSVLQALQDVAELAAQQIENFSHANSNSTRTEYFSGTRSQIWSTARSVTSEDPQEPVEAKLRLRWNGRIVIAEFRQYLKANVVNREINFDDGTALHPDESSRGGGVAS